MEVTVFDASSKVAFRGPVSANATFATGNLEPGHYVVQFNTKSTGGNKNHYLLVVSAGKKKVIATDVPGETFTGGGAAMRVQVGPDSNITGQVLNEQTTAQGEELKYKMIGDKRYVWVTAELGSNRGAHWEEEGLARGRNVISWSADDLRKRMDRGGEGSMLAKTQSLPGNKTTGY